MKLLEILDAGTMADRIDLLSKDKSTSTKAMVKLLRKKANRKNRKSDNTKDIRKQATDDSFSGYSDDSFSQANWG